MVLAFRGRRWLWQATLWFVFAALTGCGSAPPKTSSSAGTPAVVPRPGPAPAGERDGADARPPADLTRVPDAEPQVEPIRRGGPNRPYEQLGRDYVPIMHDRAFTERGLASWYGKKFHGRRTASGEVYDMYAMTAAHPTLPIPSYVRVLNPANKREVIVRINDRGPFHSGRIIDLSYTAAYKLGLLNGVGRVELTRITFEDIRTGAWRRGTTPEPAAVDRGPTEMASTRRVPSGEASEGPPVVAVAGPALPVLPSSAAMPAEPASPPSSPPVALLAEAPAASSPAAEEAAPTPLASTRPARGFWVQIGAFRQREGADGFQRRVIADLDWLAPLLGVFTEPNGFRLQAGPYASRDEAQGVAKRVREALSLVPVIVERR